LPLHKVNVVFMCCLNQFHASFISEACAQSSATKASDDSSNSTNNSDTFRGHSEVSFQWIISYIALLIILMVLSWCAGLGIFYYFTQRAPHAPPLARRCGGAGWNHHHRWPQCKEKDATLWGPMLVTGIPRHRQILALTHQRSWEAQITQD
jgi:hypothetical protein